MSGEQLERKLKDAGYVLADIARLLGVPPQSVNQSLNAKDIKSGLLEDLCRVLNKDMSFFYDIKSKNQEVTDLRKKLQEILQENKLLKTQLEHQDDPNKSQKESEVYKLWMEHMKIEKIREDFNDKMRELYQKMMEDK